MKLEYLFIGNINYKKIRQNLLIENLEPEIKTITNSESNLIT